MTGSPTFFRMIPSPIGTLTVLADESAITGLYMEERLEPGWRQDAAHTVLNLAEVQLDEFFSGTRRQFELPLAAHGTAFQRRCWAELSTIPFAETWSYGEMARRIGNPDACRAVGAANGKNPISIIVPCHRVIGSSGKLTGFGGGLPRKAALLNFERAIAFGESGAEFWSANPFVAY